MGHHGRRSWPQDSVGDVREMTSASSSTFPAHPGPADPKRGVGRFPVASVQIVCARAWPLDDHPNRSADVLETTVELDFVSEPARNRRSELTNRRRICLQGNEEGSPKGLTLVAASSFVPRGAQICSCAVHASQAREERLAFARSTTACWLRHEVSNLLARLTHHAEA